MTIKTETGEEKNVISIVVVPTDICNMHCVYCYHVPHYSSKDIMSYETLENIMKKTIPYYDYINFLWHGGEPLICGIDFYKKVIELEKKYNTNNAVITNKMQTNCTLAKGEILDYLIDEGFKFGTSFDGVTNEKTRGNSDKILEGRENVLKKDSKCSCISVITSYNVHKMIENYKYFNEKGINYKFNHYINTTKDEIGNELQIDINEYLKEEKDLFDYWLFDKNCKIRVTSFFVFLEYILFKRKILGKYNSCLGKWVGVRYNGDIVQCNRYNKSYYGNINDVNKISDAFDSEGFNKILELAVKRREKCIKACEVYDFCKGGCIVEASHEKGITEINGFSCIETKEMYKYIKTEIFKVIDNYEEYKSKLNPTVINCLDQYFLKIEQDNKIDTIIRKATESDVERIEEISLSSWVDTYKNILPNNYFEKMKKNSEKSINITKKKINQFYLIENTDKILGFLRLTEINDDTAEVNALYLDINEKQKGYGKKILNHVFNINKYKKYIITVFKDNPANIFYKKMGGILIEESVIKLGENEYPINTYEFNKEDCN